MPKKLWLTRPLEDSERFAQVLYKHGIDCLIAPVMRIAPVPFSVPLNVPDALFITSKHAAPALGKFPAAWRKLPVYCVGNTTAEYVREMGFTRITPGKSDVMALLPLVMKEFEPGAQITYISGDEIQVNIPSIFSTKGYPVERLIVYQAIAQEKMPSELSTAIADGQMGGACFFSPRSAMMAASQLRDAGLAESARQMRAFCLSQNIAKAAGTLPWEKIHASRKPTLDSMSELIVSKWISS